MLLLGVAVAAGQAPLPPLAAAAVTLEKDKAGAATAGQALPLRDSRLAQGSLGCRRSSSRRGRDVRSSPALPCPPRLRGLMWGFAHQKRWRRLDKHCPVTSPSLPCPGLQWFGFIKDYDGGTLMECRIHPTLPYATFPGAHADRLAASCHGREGGMRAMLRQEPTWRVQL